MKTHCTTLVTHLQTTWRNAIILHFTFFTLHSTLAAVPLSWQVTPRNPAPVAFDRHHGETLEFRCTFTGFGELPFAQAADIRLWYQTNGMAAAWWSVPASVSSNVLSATFPPSADPGADRLVLFFGAPSNAYASAVLRLRHSPGFTPNVLPGPESGYVESDPVFSAWLTNGYTVVSNAAVSAVRPEHFIPMANAWASDASVNRANNAARAEVARALATEGDGETRSAVTIFAQIDSATTTNDVCNIVTNETVQTEWVYYGLPASATVVRSPYQGSGGLEIVIAIGGVEYTGLNCDRTEEIDWFSFNDVPEYSGLVIGAENKAYTRNALGLARLTDLPPLTNAIPDAAARAVYDVHDLMWDETESILYWHKIRQGHDEYIAVTNIDLTHPTNAVILKAWREANQ